MKWLRTLILFDIGNLVSSADWQAVHSSYVRSIKGIEHPLGTGTLTLRRKVQYRRSNGKLGWHRNGVGYLRSAFLNHIVDIEGWTAEGNVDLGRERDQPPIRLYPSLQQYREPITSDFGGFDLVTTAPNGTRVAIEWETGNISSSHRSMNKLAIALESGIVRIGVLIVPSRLLYDHLTRPIHRIEVDSAV
jgi:hypothetical protein